MTVLERVSCSGKWVLTVMVFFALPWLLISYGLGSFWERKVTDSTQAAFARLEDTLLILRTREDPISFLSEQLRKVLEHQPGDQAVLSKIQSRLSSLQTRFPGVLHAAVVKLDGTILLWSGERRFMERELSLLASLTFRVLEDRKKAENWLPDFLDFLRTTLGPTVTPETFITLVRGTKIRETRIEEKGHFSYLCASGDYLLACSIDQLPNWDQMAIEEACWRLNSRQVRGGFLTGVFDIRKPARSLDDGLLKVMIDSERQAQERFIREDRLYCVLPLGSSLRLWASMPVLDVFNPSESRLVFLVVSFFLFAGFAWNSFRIMVMKQPFRFSIRLRLVLLFCFSGGLPVVGGYLTGLDYLQEKRQGKIRQAYDETQRLLLSFDMRFTQARSQLESAIGELLKNVRFETEAEKAGAIEVFRTIQARLQPNNLMLFEAEGEVAWAETLKADKKARKIRDAMGTLIQGVGRQLNKTPAPSVVSSVFSSLAGKLTGSKSSGPSPEYIALISVTMGSFDSVVNLFVRGLGKLVDFSFSNDRNWAMLYPIKDSRGRISHFLAMNWKHSELQDFYLRRNLLATQRLFANTQLVAMEVENRMKSFPESMPFSGELFKLRRKLEHRQSITLGEFEQDGETKLLVGIRPKELAEFYLVAVRGDDEIRNQLNSLHERMWWFIGLCGFISMFLGFQLVQRFLAPVNELSAGVQAIQQRRFKFRLSGAEQDEFGDLAMVFNHMMEGMSELEVGRIVQERLIPQQRLKMGEYVIYGRTYSASQLGGDYFDFIQIDATHVLLIVGDVSGHGVSAALVMAMMKGMVTTKCLHHETLSEIVQDVNSVFYRNLQRLHMMTCVFMLLDTERHLLEFVNAGHIFPLKGSPSGVLEEISFGNIPLGMRESRPYPSCEISLNQGDWIVSYTDGLPEACIGEEPFGFVRLREEMNKLWNGNPEDFVQGLFTRHQELVGKESFEDDRTIVVISRPGHSDSEANALLRTEEKC